MCNEPLLIRHRRQVVARPGADGDILAENFRSYLTLSPVGCEIGSRLGYLIAAHQMKEYLEWMPDAADSRAAKDSIIIWEDRAK